jgi:putative PIN family toxin of toxin-antitoxin system
VKVVVDTNVIIAGVVAEGLCRNVLKRRLPACELITSRLLLDELADRMQAKFGLNPDELPLLAIYEDMATVVKARPLPQPVCRDRDDDEILATALTAKAEIILTGDKDLLMLKEFQGIKILSPRQFVELMDRGK